MSQTPKKKLSLKPTINKINPTACQWVERGDSLEEPKHSHTHTKKSVNTETQKKRDTEIKKQFKRITLDVSPDLHYKLKKHTLDTGEPMAELLRRLAENYLDQSK